MAIWITGDTHGDFSRLAEGVFPALDRLTKKDCLIVCGDFGGLWQGGSRERKRLDRLEARPFTTLFVDGNHENFDRLARYPAEEWHGGLVRRVRPSVLHLMRGQMFALEGKRIFTMGGARSHDIEDGILDPMDPNFKDDYALLAGTQARFRVKNRTWWPEELPTEIQIEQARKFLKFANYNVDYIVTHCAPNSIIDLILPGVLDKQDKLTDFFEEIQPKVGFRRWYFGHYHKNQAFCGGLFQCLYEQIMPML